MSRDEALKRDIAKVQAKVKAKAKAEKLKQTDEEFVEEISERIDGLFNWGGNRHPTCIARFFCKAKPEICKHCQSHWKMEGERLAREEKENGT